METYSLPDCITAVCFDIDKTLYTHAEYAESQIRVLMERLQGELGLSESQTEAKVAQARGAIRSAGRTASLGNAFVELGVSIETSVSWRNELIKPYDYLRHDPALREALLSIRKCGPLLAALTNNPVGIGRRALDALGVDDLFVVVGGLDSTMHSKPDLEPFRWVINQLNVRCGEVVFVGDRFGIDLEPALALGSGGVLVEGVQEVYELPSLLGAASEEGRA